MARFIIHTITKQKNIKLSLDRWGEKRHATKRPQNGNKKITTRKIPATNNKNLACTGKFAGVDREKKIGHR